MYKVETCRVCGLTLKNVELTQAMIDELEETITKPEGIDADDKQLQKVGKIELTRQDLKTVLVQDGWINDKIINA